MRSPDANSLSRKCLLKNERFGIYRHVLKKHLRPVIHRLLSSTFSSFTSSLSEQDIAVMEAFIENAKLLLSTVGHKVLEFATGSFQTNDKSNTFHLQTTKKIKAMGKPTADGFVVLQGSKVAPNITDSLTKSISNHRQNLIDCNVIDESFIFTQDYLFTSPSLAAAIVVSHSINGRIAWKNELGQTLKDYESL